MQNALHGQRKPELRPAVSGSLKSYVASKGFHYSASYQKSETGAFHVSLTEPVKLNEEPVLVFRRNPVNVIANPEMRESFLDSASKFDRVSEVVESRLLYP